MTKPISERSVQELMEIAKNPIKDDEFKKLPPAKRFVSSAGIIQGTDKVPAALIYDRYLNWCESYKLRPVSLRTFFQEFKLYFDKVKYGNGFAYIMSCKGFNMSPEHLAMINNRKRNSSGKKKTKR